MWAAFDRLQGNIGARQIAYGAKYSVYVGRPCLVPLNIVITPCLLDAVTECCQGTAILAANTQRSTRPAEGNGQFVPQPPGPDDRAVLHALQ
ncbi:hypothetical protein A3734_11830 [Sulfitobacter sp. HI0054]|nr:hypothetical protein A3721_11220 [Sulfitobacter sp. HI0023]KZY49151.1 hypothetical protein A3734_11830 [Sulfitobacter sp. HI0054]